MPVVAKTRAARTIITITTNKTEKEAENRHFGRTWRLLLTTTTTTETFEEVRLCEVPLLRHHQEVHRIVNGIVIEVLNGSLLGLPMDMELDLDVGVSVATVRSRTKKGKMGMVDFITITITIIDPGLPMDLHHVCHTEIPRSWVPVHL